MTITFTLFNIIKIVSRPKVVYIGKHCFSYCENPKKVYMPKSIEVVGSEIFFNCKKLKEVTVSKTIADGIEFNENVKLIYIYSRAIEVFTIEKTCCIILI